MPKQKKIQPEQAPDAPYGTSIPPAILPVTITHTDSEKAQPTTLEIPSGHVLVVALHPDGTEKAGSEFFYPERSYQRFYGDESKFRVKKKVN